MEKATPILYGYFRSSSTWRLRTILKLKGIDYEYVPVNLLTGEYKEEAYTALNPAQMVPCLFIDGHYMAESLAIAEYLEERFPETRKLLPKDLILRQKVRRVSEHVNGAMQPLQNLRTIKAVIPLGADKIEWCHRWNQNGKYIALGFCA